MLQVGPKKSMQCCPTQAYREVTNLVEIHIMVHWNRRKVEASCRSFSFLTQLALYHVSYDDYDLVFYIPFNIS